MTKVIKKYEVIKVTILMVMLFSLQNASTAKAGGLENFLNFTKKGGSMTSINRGAIIEDQRSGYMTGGSIITRGPRPMELQPLTVQLPSLDFDPCTGSGDLRWGGLSYIKGQQFADFMKAIPAAAPAYILKMAIKSVNVQGEDIMASLESIVRDINGTTFNQCEQSKAIANGLMSKFTSATNQKCMAKSAIAKGGSDLYETTQKCQQDPDRFGETGDENELKAMLPDNFNLVWRALSHGNSSADNSMKELMMSISGSIIGTKVGKATTISALPSLIEKEDLIESYIGRPGKENSIIKLYVCDDSHKCLKPSIREKVLNSSSDTLYGKVDQTLQTIIDKILGNAGELSDAEQALIEYSQIPIINLFEIELALRDKNSVASLAGDSEFIEVVCYDMVVNFMRKMLLEAKNAVDELQTAQLDNTPIERFNRNIELVQEALRDKKHEAMKKLQTIVAVKERLEQQQRVFQLGFSRFKES